LAPRPRPWPMRPGRMRISSSNRLIAGSASEICGPPSHKSLISQASPRGAPAVEKTARRKKPNKTNSQHPGRRRCFYLALDPDLLSRCNRPVLAHFSGRAAAFHIGFLRSCEDLRWRRNTSRILVDVHGGLCTWRRGVGAA
jgi:hypothetical protein